MSTPTRPTPTCHLTICGGFETGEMRTYPISSLCIGSACSLWHTTYDKENGVCAEYPGAEAWRDPALPATQSPTLKDTPNA